MDEDDGSVFERTVEWAIEQWIETATYHILTPYPGTALYKRMSDQGRLTVDDWDLYDTRHTVFRLARMSADQLESGYHWAYREFYQMEIDRPRCLAARGCHGRLAPSDARRGGRSASLWDFVA